MKHYSTTEARAIADKAVPSSYIDENGELVHVTKYYLNGVQIHTVIG